MGNTVELKPGRFYRDGNGAVHGPMHKRTETDPSWFDAAGGTWYRDGRSSAYDMSPEHGRLNLIEEIAVRSVAGDEELAYAERLSASLHQRHYAERAPNWKPLSGDMIGLLTQIDNMTAALSHQEKGE